MIRVETDRLVIRDNIEDDINEHHRLMSDPAIMTYIQDIQTHSFEESKKNLEFSIEESKKGIERECFFFAITDKENGTYIGSIGFTMIHRGDYGGNAELGYFILKEFWGKGYTYEAAKAVVSYGFEKLGLHKITTGCILENHRSENIMKKMNMTKEGHLYKHVFHDGKWKDRVEYALFNNMYI